PTIAINAFTDPTTCGGNEGEIQLTFTDVPNGNQTVDHDGGSFPVVVAANAATITGLSADNYNNLRITVAGCTSTEDPDVALTDPATPAAPAANNQNFCAADNPTSNDLVPPIGGGITWYSDAGLTTTVAPGDALLSQDYFVTQTTNGCEGPEATVTVTINTPPTVDAGSDETICASDALDLSASAVVPTATDFGSLAWSTAGDGSFDDNTLLTPVYTPGATDIADGAVILTLQANGNGSCPAVVDVMTLRIEPAPTADAGSDEEICAGDEFRIIESSTIPSVTNISDLIWSTAGDGNFSNNVVLAPRYFPGPDDILNGSVVLTLQANPNAPCVLPAIDFMTLTINAPPTPTIIGATNVCLDTEEVYTTEVGQNNYIWNVTGGIITNDAGNAITVDWNGVGPYEVSVNYESATGCTAASATVQAINVETPPNSGNAVAQTACSTEAAFDLFTALDGTQDGGGTWIDDDGTGALSGADNSVFDASAVAAGGANYNFTYQVTGANCTNSDTQVTITVNSTPTISVTSFSDPTTCGGNEGEIQLTFTDVPNGLYTLDYFDGALAQIFNNVNVVAGQATISNLTTGTYNDITITVSGCTSTQDIDIPLTDPAIPTIAVNGTTDPSTCAGNDGQIVLNITGLTSNGLYDIIYDGGVFNDIPVNANSGWAAINGLTQGTYDNLSITVNGCTSIDDPDITLTDPDTPTITVVSSTDPSTCGGNDGQIVLEFTGLGNNDYVVDYDGGTLDIFINDGTAYVNGLSEGDYNNLSISHNGCTSMENPSVSLNDPDIPTIAIISSTDPSTCGGNDGQIVLEFTGLGNNDYVVDYDGGTFNIFINDGIAYVNGLSEGDYNNLSITHNGCTSLENPNITLTDPITPTIEVTDFRNPTTCGGEDGQIVLRITGVNNNFYDITYDGGVFNGVFVNGSADFARIDNVPQGTYNNLRITNNGCTSVENPNVTLVDPTPPDAPIASDQSFCAGDNPTGAQLIPAINDGFTWYSDAGLTIVVNADDALNTQNYYVTRTENGCESLATPISITINSFSLNMDIGHESCWESDDGFIDISVENGVGPFTVQINSEDAGIFSNSTFTMNNLESGSYSLSIIDSNGCGTTSSFEILPGTPNLSATINPIYTCESGLPVNTLLILFEDPTVAEDVLYALDSTDPEDFILAPEFGNINAGSHFLSIMHTNGCMVSIPFMIETFEPLSLSLSNSNPSEITASAFGGTAPYVFYFQDAAGTENNVFPVNGDGVYTVSVVDANGCEATETIAIIIPEIEIPNFFTPNNDGQNDFWGPRNTEGYPNLQTFIFDRYGRKIYIIGENRPDWDGFYQDQPLPTGDYWYIIKLNDGSGRENVGHFTLYR
ncbi:MAG: T9SS type B sorting domain-containing protein, partial [Bacteroidota bacterium]